MPSNRLVVLDVLRALALLGILIVHTHDHFNYEVAQVSDSGFSVYCNEAAHWIYRHLFIGKAFLLFSFLFGLGFFIQLNNRERQGVDFRARFVWRLVLLAIFGIIHTLFYDGDILTIFAVTGFMLVALYKASTKLLVILATLFLLQPIVLYDSLIRSGILPNGNLSHEWFSKIVPADAPDRELVYSQESWWQIATWNLTYGQYGKWLFFFYSGRLCQTLGVFLLGILAGRTKLFYHIERNTKKFKLLFVIGCVSYLILHLLLSDYMPQAVRDFIFDFRHLLQQWQNLAYMFTFVSTCTLLLHAYQNSRATHALGAIGRCTLTCYIVQTLVFTALFFSWGLGLANVCDAAVCVILTCYVFSIQLVLCRIWLQHFQYGPLEWLWRSATMLRRQPFKIGN